MKTTAILAALTLAACMTSDEVAQSTQRLYACQSSIVTCSATDSRVCFTWCETEKLALSDDDDPYAMICGGQDNCTVTCEEIQDEPTR